MEDPTSTAPFNPPISQEVQHPEEYGLAAEISQFSAFQDNWGEDLADEFKIQLDNQDDGLLESDPDSEDDSEDDDKDDSQDDSKDDGEDDGKTESNSDSEDDCKTPASFALPPLTGYSRELSKNEVLRKLNSFAKKHGFALVTKSSKPQRKVWYFACD